MTHTPASTAHSPTTAPPSTGRGVSITADRAPRPTASVVGLSLREKVRNLL